jgi:hypothetical protein
MELSLLLITLSLVTLNLWPQLQMEIELISGMLPTINIQTKLQLKLFKCASNGAEKME